MPLPLGQHPVRPQKSRPEHPHTSCIFWWPRHLQDTVALLACLDDPTAECERLKGSDHRRLHWLAGALGRDLAGPHWATIAPAERQDALDALDLLLRDSPARSITINHFHTITEISGANTFLEAFKTVRHACYEGRRWVARQRAAHDAFFGPVVESRLR